MFTVIAAWACGLGSSRYGMQSRFHAILGNPSVKVELNFMCNYWNCNIAWIGLIEVSDPNSLSYFSIVL